MKTREEVSSDKLRGGFYSPPDLVAACLDRISDLLGPRQQIRLLEPTAGDGAFLRGLRGHRLSYRTESVEAVELIPAEAAKAGATLAGSQLTGHVTAGSFLPWALNRFASFDAAVGNPPFLRFQFVSAEDRAAIAALSESLDISFKGVGNLWIPVLIGSLACLRQGGAFAFLVPTEILTGISAGTARSWLEDHATSLRVDLYPPGSFPGVLQEVIVLSGQVGHGQLDRITFVENAPGGAFHWTHELAPRQTTWTRYLLTPRELAAYTHGQSGNLFRHLGHVARFQVAAVTGANDFFAVDADTVGRYGLSDWAVPLLSRTRFAPGLRFDLAEHASVMGTGERAWLLDFSADRPDPELFPGPAEYLRYGSAAGLNGRYKTRIRRPWYRVPHIRPGTLMLSKRSHFFPRMILNAAGAVTTDTVYRGWMRTGYERRSEALVAGFHNSVTLLSAEVEGRSFGGGVLELVPTEVSRVSVPLVDAMAIHLESLSATARRASAGAEDLVRQTNRHLERLRAVDPEVIHGCESGRNRLQGRRLDRATRVPAAA